jgi:hypothetical protein
MTAPCIREQVQGADQSGGQGAARVLQTACAIGSGTRFGRMVPKIPACRTIRRTFELTIWSQYEQQYQNPGEPAIGKFGIQGDSMIAKHLATAILIALTPLAALAAASEPSEKEIRALTEKDVARANEPIIEYHRRLGKGPIPDDMLIKVNSVKKIDCSPVQDVVAFDCNIEMDMVVPQGGRRTKTMTIRFTKADDGWKGSR